MMEYYIFNLDYGQLWAICSDAICVSVGPDLAAGKAWQTKSRLRATRLRIGTLGGRGGQWESVHGASIPASAV